MTTTPGIMPLSASPAESRGSTLNILGAKKKVKKIRKPAHTTRLKINGNLIAFNMLPPPCAHITYQDAAMDIRRDLTTTRGQTA
jgi:hypothetical protein